MISSLLHLIYTLFAFLIGAGIYIYNAYKREGSKNKYLRDFSIFFVLLGIYHLFLSSFLFSNNLIVIQWSYNIALMVFFVMIAVILRIPFSILGLKTEKIKKLQKLIISLGLLVILIQIYDSRLPIIDFFIYWNANPFAAWITGLVGFLVGMIWVYTFSKNFSSLVNSSEKIKAVLIIIAAFTLSLSSLFYYTSYCVWFDLFVFILALISSFCVLAIILISLLSRKKKTSDKF